MSHACRGILLVLLSAGLPAATGGCGWPTSLDTPDPGLQPASFRTGSWIAEVGGAQILISINSVWEGGILTGRYRIGGSGRITHPDLERSITDLVVSGTSATETDLTLEFRDRRVLDPSGSGMPIPPRLLATFVATRISGSQLEGSLSLEGYDPALGPTPFDGPGAVTFRRR